MGLFYSNSSQAQNISTCFEIERILVDACAPQNTEGSNEMVRFHIGPTALNTSALSVSWPNHSWLGLCQNTNTASKVAELNASIESCGYILEPVNGVLPANSLVMLVTSETMNTASNSFAALSDTLYMIFQCGSESTGHFPNYQANGTVFTLTISFSAPSNYSDQIQYNRSLLLNQSGSVGAGDGGSVNYTANGTPTYDNIGCNAPFTPLNPAWTAPTQMCQNAASLNLAALVTGTTGGTWSGQGVSGAVFTPTGLTGAIPITYTVGIGSCAESEQHTINVINPGLPAWSIPTTICLPAANLNLNTLITGTTGGSFTGTNVSSNIFNPTGLSGTYNITYTITQSGCSLSQVHPIVVSPAVDPSWTIPAALCANGSSISLTTQITGTTGGTWSGTGVSGNNFNPSGLNGGNYNITYSVGTGTCILTSTQAITVLNAPSGNWTAPTSMCQLDPAIDLSTLITGTSGGTWTGQGVSASMFNPSGLLGAIPISYYVTNGPCPITVSHSITITPVATPTWTAPSAMCASAEVVSLNPTITGTTGGTWSGNGISNSQFNPTGLLGNINVTYTVGTGNCQASATHPITVEYVPPAPSISGISDYCIGVVPQVLTATGVTNASFEWFADASLVSSTGTSATHLPIADQTSTYYCTQTVGNCSGLAASYTVTYHVLPNAPHIDTLIHYCPGEAMPLLQATANGNIQWFASSALSPAIGNGNSFQTTASSGNEFWLTATDQYCTSLPAHTRIQLESIISVNITLTGNPVLCKNAHVLLTSDHSTGNLWSTGSMNDSITVYTAGLYTVAVTGWCNTARDTVYITSHPAIADFYFTPGYNIAPAEVQFYDESQNADSTWWIFQGDTIDLNLSEVMELEADGNYSIQQIVWNSDGCWDSLTKVIKVISDLVVIYLPNTFTPNNDGLNDIFQPKMFGVEAMECLIFNRWGEKIAVFDGLYSGWDGTVNGRPAPEDVYVYVINTRDVLHKTHQNTGTLSLIR